MNSRTRMTIKRVGNSINDLYGYVSDGLYIDEQDRLNSPKTDSGAAYAGDIKYRDLNGDGVITEQDQRKIGDSNLAEWSYGFFVGAAYKGLDVKALLQELQIGIIHMLILILWPLK